MSVRKTAARSGAPSGGAGVLKSLGFWALLAGASFIVGLFILSPLINKANEGARPAAAAPGSVGPRPAPTPTAGLNTGQSSRDDRSAARRTDSDVQITPDTPADGGVQKSSTVDDPAQTEYRERRAQMERSLGDSGARPSDSAGDGRQPAPDGAAVDTQPAGSPDRASRSDSTDSTDSAAADSRPRRRRRGHRDNAPSGDAPATPPASGNASAPVPPPATGGTDVQRGDTIDR